MEEGGRRAAAASAVLPVLDELIVDIFTRLPARSLCLCKCVSRAWRAFISDPTNRRRFAQTLSGLLLSRGCGSRPSWDFIGLSMSSVLPPPPGVDTALSFLPPTCAEMELLDSCNGLLLLRCQDSRELPSPPPFYVVCNPATGEWVTLPQPSLVPGFVYYSTSDRATIGTGSAALGFDPSISSHFHVFQLVQMLDDGYNLVFGAVEIYSSQTGRWVCSEIQLQGKMDEMHFYSPVTGQMTYFKGFLHICMSSNAIVSVDTEGKTRKISRLLDRHHGHYKPSFDICRYICHSQGRLLYVYRNAWFIDFLSIYVLEDIDSEEWTWVFKQSTCKPDIFGPRMPGDKWAYYAAAFHPDSNLIFFYDFSQKRLVSYDMKHRDVHVICTLEVPYSEFLRTNNVPRKFFPYVPLYSRALPPSSLN